MAIYCEFINLIIPISKIDLVYSGGFTKFKEDNAFGFSIGVLWNDEFLFRDGAMNPIDIDYRIKKWENLGLKGLSEVNGVNKWIDFCLFEGIYGSSNLSCDWLLYDSHSKSIYFKDQPFGQIAFPIKRTEL
jgi:hypothetical protein